MGSLRWDLNTVENGLINIHQGMLTMFADLPTALKILQQPISFKL
jgi:hypothetical protein